VYVDHLAAELRAGLFDAGVTRAKLFEKGENRLRLRAHDLRATFVTLALANGKTEDWVVTRTGHRTSAMVAKYRRQARTAEELKLGWFVPLHEAIPELAVIRSPRQANGHDSRPEAAQ
jgi:integrase